MITKLNPATGKIEKMSKSRGNTVSPDELIARFGADTVRLYTLFIGPPEKESEWSEEGVVGASRFFKRVHELCARVAAAPAAPSAAGADSPLPRLEHRTIQRVTEDAARFHFHTAVAALDGVSAGDRRRDRREGTETPASLRRAARTLVAAPASGRAAPDARSGGSARREGFLLERGWPSSIAALATAPRVTLVVQVNGKVRGKLERRAGRRAGRRWPSLARTRRSVPWVDGKEIARSVYVPDRLLNLVVR